MFGLPYLIFILTLTILGVLSYRYRERKDIVLCLNITGFIVALFFIGLRGFVMFDWRNYYPEFQNMTSGLSENAYGLSREIGWTWFCLIIKAIYDDYHFMVFIHSAILLGLLVNFLRKYTSNLLFALAICLAFEGFVISFNLLRNSIAMGLFLNAIPYLSQRKAFPYFGICLLAVGFHYSSLFFFPLYFFLHRKLNKYIYLAYFLFCAVVYMLSIPIFEKMAELVIGGNDVASKVIELYSNMSHEVKISPIFLERMMTGILIFCYYDKLNKFHKEAPIFINSFLLYISCTFLFSDFSEISSRLSLLFVYSYWMLYCNIPRCFYYRNNKLLFVGFISLYCMFRTTAPMRSEIYQYENILFGARSFNARAAMFDRLNVDDN